MKDAEDEEDKESKESKDTFILHVSRDQEAKEASREKAAEADEETDENVDEKETEVMDREMNEETDEVEVSIYTRVGESKIIYQISESEYKSLMDVSYHTLRHQEILPADFNDVTQFEITLEGVDYTITSEQEDEKTIWYYQEEEISTADIKSALMLLKADSFTDEQPSQKEEISLTVHLNNENFQTVQIELFRYDGSHCLAVVNGRPMALVERSYVVDLVEAVNGIVLN